VLSGSNTYVSTTVVTGTLQIGNGGTTGTIGSGTVAVASGAVLAFQRSDESGWNQLIAGAGQLESVGGTLNLTNTTNSFSGGVRLNGGTLSFVTGGAWNLVRSWPAGSATLRWNGSSFDPDGHKRDQYCR